jgi:hypothetical protein
VALVAIVGRSGKTDHSLVAKLMASTERGFTDPPVRRNNNNISNTTTQQQHHQHNNTSIQQHNNTTTQQHHQHNNTSIQQHNNTKNYNTTTLQHHQHNNKIKGTHSQCCQMVQTNAYPVYISIEMLSIKCLLKHLISVLKFNI